MPTGTQLHTPFLLVKIMKNKSCKYTCKSYALKELPCNYTNKPLSKELINSHKLIRKKERIMCAMHASHNHMTSACRTVENRILATASVVWLSIVQWCVYAHNRCIHAGIQTHSHTHIDSETTICKVRHFIMQGVVKRKEDHQEVKMYFGLTVKKGKMDAYTENVL